MKGIYFLDYRRGLFLVRREICLEGMFLRTQMLIGERNSDKLKSMHVAVFGIGGVGCYAAECLVRSGIGNISIFDDDTVDVTNINRQIIALGSTLGINKVDVMKKRILDINPDVNVHTNCCFYSKDNSDRFDFSEYDYIIDAIDTVSSKIEIIVNAKRAKSKIISSMGTGNKLDPTRLEVSDIYNTSVCPLARVMRHELRKREISDIKVVYSREAPIKSQYGNKYEQNSGKPVPGSMVFVPAAAGVIMASEVVRDLIGIEKVF